MAETNDKGIATNLVGKHGSWFSSRGKESGPIMAVYEGNYGRPTLLVLVDGQLRAKDAEGVYVE